MSVLTLSTPCPACSATMRVGALVCSCGVRVEGAVSTNEFATLVPDDLHLLRIFVMCEGRIRDMEAALGVSYPTVKARLKDLKRVLRLGDEPGATETADEVQHESGGFAPDEVHDLLDQLESGEVTAAQAIIALARRPGDPI